VSFVADAFCPADVIGEVDKNSVSRGGWAVRWHF